MSADPRIVDAPEFTDRLTLRLIPRDEVDAGVLRDLIAVIEQAQEQIRGKPVRMKGHKPDKTEHCEQQHAVSRAFSRIEQIAAASRIQAERQANNVKANGPMANAGEIAAAVADLNDAVARINLIGGRVDARPVE